MSYKTLVIASWFCMPLIILAQTRKLSLRSGIYVLQGVDCKQAPFAALKSWDGVGFAGPHSSKCVSQILSQHDSQYSISTTCAALGDGTPDRSGYVDVLSLTRVSDTRFVVHNKNKVDSTYRWCSAK